MSLLSRFVTRSEFESHEDFSRNFELRVPESFNFAYDVVDVYAEEEPDRRAMVWCDEREGERVFTFAEMKRYCDQAARAFYDAGIRKGDPVILILKKRYEFWFCLLGLHKIGAVAVPATHMLTAADLAYRISGAGVKMALCGPSEELLSAVEAAEESSGTRLMAKGVIGGSRAGWLDFGSMMEQAPPEFARPEGAQAVGNHDISMVYFSSGTTGYPKMVQHDFTYPLGHILTAKYWQNVEDGGLHFTVADTGWAKSAWGKIYGQWICGSAVFVYDYDTFNAASLLRKATEHRVTTFCAPPTVYRFLIKEDLSQYDLSYLRYCVTAGEPLNPEVYERFLQQTGLAIREAYGQTETTVLVVNSPWMTPKPGSMGRPVPGYAITLLNDEGHPCDIGEEGEIVVDTRAGHPVGMFLGYRHDPDRTEATWHDGYYRTGDMAWADEDGYLWFVGRADDLIKSSGYRIGPFEVESALMEHPGVLECAVTGVPDELRGQVVKASIVLAKGYQAGDSLKTELQEHVKRVTAPYKYPRVIEFVTELPKTISGKIRRVAIRSQDGE